MLGFRRDTFVGITIHMECKDHARYNNYVSNNCLG